MCTTCMSGKANMASPNEYNVFVGAETGLLKGIDTAGRNWNNLNTVDKAREITCLCYGGLDEAELSAGLRNNCVLTVDLDSPETSISEVGPLSVSEGSGHINAVAKFKDRFLTGFSGGVVTVWTGDQNDEDVLKLTVGDNLWAMTQSDAEPNVIATGGKENPLKLWDVNNSEAPVFSSKNVRNDWLNLRVPVWITKIKFLSDNRRVVTGTGYNQVRVFDPKSSQRRPVIDISFMTYPVTGLSVSPHQEDQVIVGNTFGDMGLIDLRTKKTVQLYKGFSGGITDLQCHCSAPVVVSCSIDRFLRIHDINSKALIDKFYLKSRLNCLLLSDKWPQDEEEHGGKIPSEKSIHFRGDKDSNEERGQALDDDFWDTLDVVKTETVNKNVKTRQKRKTDEEQGEKSEQKEPKQKKKKKRSSNKNISG